MKRSRTHRVLAVFLTLQILLHFAVVAVPVLQQGAPTFVSYYTASWLMIRGEFTGRAYETDWFADQTRIAMQDSTANDIIAPNMPTVAFGVLPLLAFPPHIAKMIFTLTSWAASWTALLLAVWCTRPKLRDRAELWWLIGGTLLAWSSPFLFNLRARSRAGMQWQAVSW